MAVLSLFRSVSGAAPRGGGGGGGGNGARMAKTPHFST